MTFALYAFVGIGWDYQYENRKLDQILMYKNRQVRCTL